MNRNETNANSGSVLQSDLPLDAKLQKAREELLPNGHPWGGIGHNVILPPTLERLVSRIEALGTQLAALKLPT